MTAPLLTPPPCRHHADRAAGFYCRRCAAALCEACVRRSDAAATHLVGCGVCGSPVQTIDTAPLPEHQFEDPRPFWPRLMDAPMYPLRGTGWAVLLTGTAVVLVLRLILGALLGVMSTEDGGRRAETEVAAYALPLLLFAAPLLPLLAYTAAYLMKVMHHTAAGERDLPDWPDLTELWHDIARPLLMVAGLGVMCSMPALMWRWSGAEPREVEWVLWGAAAVYLPMALLATAVHDSIWAANAWTVLRAIVLTGRAYAATWCIGALFAMLLRAVAEVRHVAPLLASVIAAFLSLYGIILTAHLLGQVYHAHRYRLRWIHRDNLQPLAADDDDDTPPPPPPRPADTSPIGLE